MKIKILLLSILLFALLFSSCTEEEDNPVSSEYGLISGQLLFDGSSDDRLIGTRIGLYETFSALESNQISVAFYSDSTGDFSFENLEPGNYYIDAWNDADNDGQISYYDLYTIYGAGEYPNFQPKPISVKAGETNTLQIDLGTVENPLPDINGTISVSNNAYTTNNISVRLFLDSNLDQLYRETQTNPDGSYLFLDVDEGSYYLTAQKDIDANGSINDGDLFGRYPNTDSTGFIEVFRDQDYQLSFSIDLYDPNSDIPPDPTNVTPPTPTKNNLKPTATFQAQGERIKVNLQGLIDPTTQQPITLFYNSDNPAQSNIFLQQNGVTKGLIATKVGSGTVLKADVVFVVDNSGSMGEEADNIARDITSFAQSLSSSGLDVKFGCIGQDGSINGAVNLTTVSDLSNYLNRSGYIGTYRTVGFSGNDAATLESNASNYGYAGGENGVQGCLFAHEYFSWRAGASKVFINFTDEPTQPASDLNFNTAQLCNTLGGLATVHTVFSADSSYYSWDQYRERPWAMSECTGGTVQFINASASNLVLSDLPVVGALTNSYLVEYMKGTTTVQEWLVNIIIYTSTSDGEITYRVTY